jgi:molybdopterin/thiamine biosynthesis adenylyltransferase
MSATISTHLAGPQSVTVIGAGNIGSALLPLVGRMAAVGSVTIVDHDSYEEKNLVSQSITPADVGRPKAVVQAERLREIKPRLRVTPLVERVENVPPGALRADVIAGCLDSRRARRFVNQIAWRLGIPFVDSGVQGDGMLARVHVYRPGPDNVCLECLWDEQVYQAERETFACDGTLIAPAPTHSTGSLGALAAAVQAIEVEKILANDWERVAVGHEVLIDAKFHRHFVTRLPRNAGCRFDHRTLAVREFCGTPSALTLADLFGQDQGDLRVEGQVFATQWACGACQTAREMFGLRDRIAGSVACPHCGKGMRAIGFHTLDRLAVADVPNGAMSAPLSVLGFQAGDIFTTAAAGDGEVHFEITTPAGGAS